MERIEGVDRLDALRLHIPLEHPQHDLVGGKIRDGEAVLLDRLDVFVHVEMGGRQRTGAPTRRRPAAGRVLIGPVNTALIGLAEKSSLPLRIMRPMARACRSPLITSGTRSRTADIDSMRRSCCLSQPGCQ